MKSQFYSETWKALPWKKFRQDVFRLQNRIWKAQRVGNKAKVLSLQKLLLKSRAARLLAIRQVTQLNQGKKTAGVDGIKSLNFKQRLVLEEDLRLNINNWKSNKLREIPIPKKDGSTRMLKIPTIRDRAWQCLVKYAMEPAHEATFHARSYGFRPGRSAHDAQKLIQINLRSNANGKDKTIIEIDIEKCFDRINQQDLMKRVIAPQTIKQGLWRCLKLGTNPGFPDQGTPQGGVISPLLANISLNGIEEIQKSRGKRNKTSDVIRYADDMVIILKPNVNPEKVLQKVEQFLATRGLNTSQKKTKITAPTDGFDFLGWNFKVQTNDKLQITPSEDNFKAFREKVKDAVNNSNYGAKVKAHKLAAIVRGWKNYHKHCDMNGSRFSLWFLRHRTWKVFNKETKLNRESTTSLIKKAFPTVPVREGKFVNVLGDKSPYDGDLIYWSERNSKLYDNATAKVLKKQNHMCGHCGHRLISDERVQLHHIDGNHNNWKPKNLMAMHESCHDYTHMSKGK